MRKKFSGPDESCQRNVTDLVNCLVKAKFHYTDPTRTRHGPDTDPHGLFCGETPLGPCGSPTKSVRVRVVEFSYNEFQAAGPATEKARRPNIESRCRGTNSWWQAAAISVQNRDSH